MYAQLEQGNGYLAKIEPESFVDGEGVRCSVYVSGCPFNCVGCYNKAAQHFKYGTPFTDEQLDSIIDACSADYISGLSILGGEPFCNIAILKPLTERFRQTFGQSKTIWVWSGFMFETLLHETKERRALLNQIDVLVDGPFVQALYQPNLPYKGSLNQRVIDVQASLKYHKPILYI